MNWCTVGKPWALDLGEEVGSSSTSCCIVKLSKPESLVLASSAINREGDTESQWREDSVFCEVLGAQWMFEGASSAETPPPFLSAWLFPLPSPVHPQERAFEHKIKAGDR